MTSLTTAQQTTLKTFLQNTAPFNTFPLNQDGYQKMADALLVIASPDFFVWRSDTPIADIQDNITWANFTPANPSAGGGQDVANWLSACHGKQSNLQIILGAATRSGTINTTKDNIRAGLQDCLSQIPSGPSGGSKTGGWTQVQLVIQRQANILEKLFAVGTGSNASPAKMVIEGGLGMQDIQSLFTV